MTEAEEAEDEYILNTECPICEKDALVQKCRIVFNENFKRPTDVLCYGIVVPARLFLIGEHAQACGDRAIAMAVPYYVVAYGRHRRYRPADSTLIYYCPLNTMYEIKRPYSVPGRNEEGWITVVRSMLATMPNTFDMDIVLTCSIPSGVNMGQEAALQLCILSLHYRLIPHFDPTAERLTINECMRLCWEAEQYYIGQHCKAVDLYVQTTSRPNNFVLFESANERAEEPFYHRTWDIVFPKKQDFAMILIDSGVRCSEFSERTDTVWSVISDTARYLREHNWMNVQQSWVINHLFGLRGDIALHIVGERDRIDQVLTALLDENCYLLGQVLSESHYSASDLLGVSCPEVDEIVRLSLQVDGVYGSRMASYGYGGFVFTYVKRNYIRNLVEHIKANYDGNATFRECVPVNSVTVYSPVRFRDRQITADTLRTILLMLSCCAIFHFITTLFLQ